ncbi:porphobilinogen deaminase [Syntrophothermus lipocalidus DSM 12680]|uniref:Porphobilinogen deaminase n=2 Tax=Syntrophothermus TaxID=129001 RepID=D7CNA5_SYNLT|nr:porphobilinogen deaminase [Syntrophothermus lipocalidus DSM 12680]
MKGTTLMAVKVRIGTRGSRLALWQANYVVKRLRDCFPGHEFEITVIKTKGDKITDVALSKIGDKGLFTKEIEMALLREEIDIAVHSLKDLPTTLPEGIRLAAVLERENPLDVLLSFKGYSLSGLPRGARIGTSSLRRTAQLKRLRPDIETVNLRGNVETRIRKMEDEGLDGIVLAYAGVKRMGFLHLVTEILHPDQVIPAVGQGVIALEIKEDGKVAEELVKPLNHQPTWAEITAERAFLKAIEGGCQVPCGCHASYQEGYLTVDGLVASLDGQVVYRDRVSGSEAFAQQLGEELARRILAMGGGSLLETVRCMGD